MLDTLRWNYLPYNKILIRAEVKIPVGEDVSKYWIFFMNYSEVSSTSTSYMSVLIQIVLRFSTANN